MSRLSAFARLVRLPNLPSAVSNILMAALAASAPLRLWPAVGLAVLASSCFYMAGMVFNDWFDLEQDRRERPERPLPSGEVTPDEASRLGWMLMAGGGLCAVLIAVVGDDWFTPQFLALWLVLAVFFYDGWAKRGPLGPPAMALCRVLNVAFGLAAAGFFARSEGGPGDTWFVLHLLLIVALYITGVTLFARTEAHTSSRLPLTIAAVLIMLALLLVLPLPLWRKAGVASELFPYLLVAFGFLLGVPIVQAIRTPAPSHVQAAVGRCLLGLVVLDALIASALAGSVGLLLVLLLPAGMYLRRQSWMYAT
jgi:4-hydroxybenzoate polyprenyltransferase